MSLVSQDQGRGTLAKRPRAATFYVSAMSSEIFPCIFSVVGVLRRRRRCHGTLLTLSAARIECSISTDVSSQRALSIFGRHLCRPSFYKNLVVTLVVSEPRSLGILSDCCLAGWMSVVLVCRSTKRPTRCRSGWCLDWWAYGLLMETALRPWGSLCIGLLFKYQLLSRGIDTPHTTQLRAIARGIVTCVGDAMRARH